MTMALRWGRGCGVLLAAALMLAPPAGAVEAGAFAVQVPLTLEGAGPWYRLTLPLDLQMHARHTDLRDLRVFDAAGVAMPYAVVRAAARAVQAEKRTPVRIFPLHGAVQDAAPGPAIRLHIGADGTLLEVGPEAGPGGAEPPPGGMRRGWLLDLSAVQGGRDTLMLDWQSTDEGFQRFHIEGSNDLKSWSPLGGGQIARLSFNGEHIDQREVELGARRHRYLRLLWEAPREAPRLTGVQLRTMQTTLQDAPLVWSAPLTAQRDRNGDYLLTLPVALPLQRLRVDLPQANTLAPLEVAGRHAIDEPRAPWAMQARTILYRLPLDEGETVQDELELPGRALRQLRLRIDARGGGLGADSLTVHAGLTANEVIFLARGRAPYLLALGDEHSLAADLPVTTLVPGYSRQSDHVGSAYPVAAQPPVVAGTSMPKSPASAAADWKRLLLWALLLGGVGLLVMMTLHLVRKPGQ